VAVTAAIVALGIWQPFAPGGGDVQVAGGGDPARGETLFAESCAACHGVAGEGGGGGPALNDAPIDADAATRTILVGRGTMPAGILAGQDAADVGSYVAQISGAEPGTPVVEEPPAVAGEVQFTGPRLWGIFVSLNAPADATWTVWLAGPGEEAVSVGEILAGQATLADPDLGIGTIIDRFNQVLIGEELRDAELITDELSTARIAAARNLIIGDGNPPGANSLISIASDQLDVLAEHTRFLVQARDEANLANVRFHSEHLVNIALGDPIADIDGNGEPTNPGDGVGVLGRGGRQGYLPQIQKAAGEGAVPTVGELVPVIEETVADARECGAAESVEAAEGCVAAIELRAPRIEQLWGPVPDAARASVVLTLERR